MDKKLLDALAAKAEQRKADKTKAKQFEVGGQLLDFVKLGHTAQLDAYEAFTGGDAAMPSTAARTSPRSSSTTAVRRCRSTELHTALGVTDPYDADLGADGCPRGQCAWTAALFAWLGLLPEDENAKAEQDPAKN